MILFIFAVSFVSFLYPCLFQVISLCISFYIFWRLFLLDSIASPHVVDATNLLYCDIADVDMDALSKQVADRLRIGMDKHGVTTEAEWVTALRNGGKLNCSESFDNFLEGKKNGWISTDAFTFPETGTLEIVRDDPNSGVQAYVTSVLRKISESTYVYAASKTDPNKFVKKATRLALTSLLDPEAYRRQSFGHRKPDVVAYECLKSGAFAITLIGDCKGASSLDKDFHEAEIGHILDMSKELLTKFQVFRYMMISFLTDGRRFQFFKMKREEGEFHFSQSKVYTNTSGWQVDFM